MTRRRERSPTLSRSSRWQCWRGRDSCVFRDVQSCRTAAHTMLRLSVRRSCSRCAPIEVKVALAVGQAQRVRRRTQVLPRENNLLTLKAAASAGLSGTGDAPGSVAIQGCHGTVQVECRVACAVERLGPRSSAGRTMIDWQVSSTPHAGGQRTVQRAHERHSRAVEHEFGRRPGAVRHRRRADACQRTQRDAQSAPPL